MAERKVEEIKQEIKGVFRRVAEERKYRLHGQWAFDLEEVVSEVYDRILASRHYTNEERQELLRMFRSLDSSIFEEWQEEIYEKWDSTF